MVSLIDKGTYLKLWPRGEGLIREKCFLQRGLNYGFMVHTSRCSRYAVLHLDEKEVSCKGQPRDRNLIYTIFIIELNGVGWKPRLS